jgi:hypothetical protein
LTHDVGFDALGHASEVGAVHWHDPAGQLAPLGHACPQAPQFEVVSGLKHAVGLAADGHASVSPLDGHSGTHALAAPLQANNPLLGGLPLQVTHAPGLLPQSSWLEPQLLHEPFEQDSPVAHLCPHAPQLFGSLEMCVSQPVAMLPVQFAKPELQARTHFPLLQLGVLLVVLHAWPQVPQLLGSV